MNQLFSKASRINQLPILNKLSPKANRLPSDEDLQGYLQCQRLAQTKAKEVAGLLQVGMSEKHAAGLLNDSLKEAGVEGFFHRGFAWWGDRCRFNGHRHTGDFLPSERKLKDGEVFILDVAPIYQGYMCDIGYSGVLGENDEFDKAMAFLEELRAEIPALFLEARSGGEVCRAVDQRIKAAGYDNIHAKYPFAVLGHRIHKQKQESPSVGFMNFGWQSYWSFLSRGLFGQLLNGDFEGDTKGLWAIEPHIGGKGFGVKFEEILLVDKDEAHWLEEKMFR